MKLVNIMSKFKSFFRRDNLKSKSKMIIEDCIKMPVRLMVYPIRGYEEFKYENKSKNYVSIFYLIMMIIAQVIAFNGDGFLVNKNNPNDFNLLMTIALIIFPVAIFVFANWATTALMDGKGNMSQIFRVITYSFFPYVWLSLLASIISNYITADEVVFFTALHTLGIGLLAYMLFFGMLGIHEYGLFKTILMFLFTIVAIAVILFIILLFFSLIQQVYAFVKSLYDEFVMRFLVWTR
ncbi:MAG: Yip1 family protein [Candidatus Izemoplasmatales bacterium]|nr:Yip1 family protein [Candidatus Izemoplasmatales bacterium]